MPTTLPNSKHCPLAWIIPSMVVVVVVAVAVAVALLLTRSSDRV